MVPILLMPIGAYSISEYCLLLIDIIVMAIGDSSIVSH